MDHEAQQKIIARHGHLIASRHPSQSRIIDGLSTADDSGPPSPNFGGAVKNFGEVVPGFYRSSFPYAANLEHLRSLKLKTILTLVNTKNETPEYDNFIAEDKIHHIRIEVPAHKNVDSVTPIEIILQVLRVMLDKSNYPLLVHCNKGKHRTGCMVACYRKLQGWSTAAIITEYRRYAEEKFRPLDEAFITAFNATAAQQLLNGNNQKITYAPLEVESPINAPSMEVSSSSSSKPFTLPTPPPSEKETEDESSVGSVGLSPDTA